MSDLPPLDLSILQRQLDELFERACRLAWEHRKGAELLGVSTLHWKYWDVVFNPSSGSASFEGISDAKNASWSSIDGDGEGISMTVPVSILDGTTTVEEWATRTYEDYRTTEDLKKQKKDKADKEARKAQYEKLRREFE